MKVTRPKVKLISLMDNRVEAWDTSLHGNTNAASVGFDVITTMDLSLNSMRVYTLEITSSLFFRDLVLSLRPISAWAQGVRNMPLNRDTLKLSAEFSDRESDDAFIGEFLERIAEGAHVDNVREILPCSLSTTYTVCLDHRVLLGFCKSLEILNPRLFRIYGHLILNETLNFEEYVNCKYSPVHEFYMIQQSELGAQGVDTKNEITFGVRKMKLAFASQFLRQHYSKIKIELWNLVGEYFEKHLQQKHTVRVAYYVDRQSYRKLMSMRSHWSIDWAQDMWGGLVDDYINKMTLNEFWHFLPNGAGKPDPYLAHSLARVSGEFPGLPCPILCEWPDLIHKREEETGGSLLLDQYRELFRSGFVKNNPDNSYRIAYQKNLASKEQS